MTNIINLTRSTIETLINANSTSRRTTASEVAETMNQSLSDKEKVTSDVVRSLVSSGLLNTKDVQEFELCKGRYGGIREVDIEGRKEDERKAQIKAKRQAAAAKARQMLEAKRNAVVVEA